MAQATFLRGQELLDSRFRKLLASWLETLPRSGWTGGVAELFNALESLDRDKGLYAFVPAGSALTKAVLYHATAFAACGFAVRSGRTKSARFIAVKPIAKGGR